MSSKKLSYCVNAKKGGGCEPRIEVIVEIPQKSGEGSGRGVSRVGERGPGWWMWTKN